MTTPTLELNLKASGVEQVDALKAALAGLRTEVGELANIGKQMSALDQVTVELRGLRTDVQAIMKDLNKVVTEGVKGTFQQAEQQAKQGGKDLVKSFDDNMKQLISSISKRNEEIAALDTKLNGKLTQQAAASGKAVGESFAQGLEQSGVKVALAYSVALGGGGRASLRTSGLGNFNVLMEKAKEIEGSVPALEASTAKAVAALDKNVAKVISAATMPAYMNAGPKWWESIIAEWDKAAIRLEAEEAKTIVRLERQVSKIMKAATQPAYLAAGPAWWEKTLAEIDSAAAKVEAAYQKEIGQLETQVSRVMKAATQPGYLPAGPKWWEKVVADMDAGRDAIIKRQVQIATLLAAGPYSMSEGSALGKLVTPGAGSTVSALDAVAKQARYQVGLATGQAAGAYSSLTNGQVMEPAKLNSVSAALRQFTLNANDAHSAARGLSSGLGLLWLTWGTMLPLLAGAALSNAFVQVIKLGSEVNNTFEQIRVLTGESVESVARLETQMLSLARSGPIGPSEIAKAMKILALAGLDAEKVGSSIKEVLNFAIAGDTTIERAADVMTSVATAFGVSAKAYSYVGDTISVAAAESKSSVESMGAAFKTASVINQQYGVSLEDTAVGLSLLANAGIQGTSAGTALRNMYADLAGRTPKVTKALKELGVEALDPLTGKMREQAVVFKELMTALAQRTPTAQFKYIQDIFSERGGKEAMAILTALRDTAVETGQAVGNAYEALAEKISEAAGFTSIAAAQMALTPLNRMKSVVSSLQATLEEAFSSMEPTINDVTNKLKAAFGSDEFKSGLQTMIQLVASLTTFLVDHAKGLATVAIGYTMLKGAVTIIGALAVATENWGKITAAANTLVGATGRAAAIANPLLTLLATGITLAAGAWSLYTLWAEKGKQAQDAISTGASAKELLGKLQEEETRLMKVVEARNKNISLMQLEAQITLEKARSEKTPEMQKAETDFARNEALIAKYSGTEYAKTVDGETQLNKLIANRSVLQGAISAATQQHGEELLKIERTIQHIKDLEGETARQERERMKSNLPPSGPLGRPDPQKGRLSPDSDMKTIEAEFTEREKMLKSAYSNEMALLDNLHKNKLISEGQYEVQSLIKTQNYEGAVAQSIEESGRAQLEEYRQRVAEARRTVKPENLQQVLDNLKNEYTTFSQKLADAQDQVADSAHKRLVIETQNATGAVRILNEESDKYWKKAEVAANKESAVAKARMQMVNATEEERAGFEAVAKVTEQHGVFLEKLTTEYGRAQESLAAFQKEFDTRVGPMTEQEQASYQAAADRMNAAATRLEKARTELDKLKAEASETAIIEVQNKKVQDLRNEATQLAKRTASSIVDALLSGGKEGAKKLREIVIDIFKAPIKVILQALVQGGANILVNTAYSALGLNNAVSGTSGLLNTANLYGGAKSLFAPGGMGDSVLNSLGAGFGGSGIGGAAMGGAEIAATAESTSAGLLAAGASAEEAAAASAALATSLETGAAAAGTFGAGMTAALAAVPVVGWIAAGAAVLYSIFGNKGGGPKIESAYGYNYAGTSNPVTLDPRTAAADPSKAREASRTIESTYTSLATQLGMLNKTLQVGVLISTDPKGTAKTILGVESSAGYDRNTRMGGIENVGRTDEDLQKALAEEMVRVIAQALTSSQSDLTQEFKDYILAGISAATSDIEDLKKRIQDVADVKGTRQAFLGLGEAFAYVQAMSIESTTKLIEMAGGLGNLTSGLNAFYSNFYTDVEKRTALEKLLQGEFAKLGITMPKTREEFKKLVEAQKVTTEEGQKTFLALIGLSGAFAQLTEAITTLNSATATQSDLDERVAKARALLQKAYDNEAGRLTQLRDRMQSFADKLTSFLDELTMGSLAGLTPQQQYAAAQSKFQQYQSDLNSSDPLLRDAALSHIEEAGRALLEASRTMFGASDGYYSDLSQVVTAVQQSKDLAETGVDTAQLQLTVLNNMVTGLVNLQDSTHNDLATLYDVNGTGLLNLLNGTGLVHDGVLDLTSLTDTDLQALITAMGLANGNVVDLNGVSGTGFAAVVTAIHDLQVAILNAGAGPSPSDDTLKAAINELYKQDLGRTAEAGGLAFYTDLIKNQGYTLSGVESLIKSSPEYVSREITSFYQEYLGRTPEADGMSFYQNLFNSGIPLSSIEDMIKHSPEATAYNGGVPLREGLDRVPYDNFPATLHKDEAVLTAGKAERWRNQAEENDALVRQLMARVASLEGTLEQVGERVVQAQFASAGAAAQQISEAQIRAVEHRGWRDHVRGGAPTK